MATLDPKLHFVLFPMMAQGHMIPMMDTAKLLAHHENVIVTIVTTPKNASRFTSIIARYVESGLHIQLIQLEFPCKEFGLPEGCENLDMLPGLALASNFFNVSKLLQQEVEKIFQELTPPATCIISDMFLPYTIHIARKFNIPRISFAPTGLGSTKINEALKQFNEDMLEAEMSSYGIITNSFEELEPTYATDFKKMKNDKVWCIGPVSLSNIDDLDKVQRGNSNKVLVHEWKHLKWLNSHKDESVIYACLGSLCNLTSLQLIELGLALEATKKPFIWVIREGNQLEELEKWIEESGFEGRINDRGLVIKGWAPQLLILSHPAIGGFLTHCGWNSTMEAICAGVPMVTWPLFGDQFFNECLVVQILKVGVKIGVKSPMQWGEEEKSGVLVKKEDVERGIEVLMDETSECKERRKRIRELAEIAKKAVEKGGSSHSNVVLFIQDIIKIKNKVTKTI
ncbi:UDP-glycosyltransferase 73C6 [Medicago truncatula]|uniref:UDP-glycosyltransferase 73C6 n=1 Tax=Medicago truncatula TaxID=3880 RepID=UPI0019673B1D|nr:UDP-glycosyltransferase 73C6 [Medicago truncatula]